MGVFHFLKENIKDLKELNMVKELYVIKGFYVVKERKVIKGLYTWSRSST